MVIFDISNTYFETTKRDSKIYQGNTADSTTLDDMLDNLEKHTKGNINRTVVIDAGIATEDNLALLNAKKYKYVCVSRKRLKTYPKEVITQQLNIEDKAKNHKIALSIFKPKEHTDTWMYVQSQANRKKEQVHWFIPKYKS